MNRGGRPAKPTALHKVEATFRADRHDRGRRGEPQPEGDLEIPPDWLTEGQRESWEYAIANAPKGLLKRLDRGLLNAWVVAEDQLRSSVTMLAMFDAEPGRLPLVVLTPNGLRLSPYFKAIHQAIATMISVSDRLGFSPASRPRISIEPRKPEEPPRDAWSSLRRFPVIPGRRSEAAVAVPRLRRKSTGTKSKA
jgi:phage terminase small subunit